MYVCKACYFVYGSLISEGAMGFMVYNGVGRIICNDVCIWKNKKIKKTHKGLVTSPFQSLVVYFIW